jgi:hypothetical protein
MQSPASPLHLPQGSFEGFQLIQCGSIQVATGPGEFGFQIEVTPSVVLSQTLVALVDKAAPSGQAGSGFGIRIDWERGEIWDAINGSGLIGWLEEDWQRQDDTVSIRFEVERMGSALLPRLTIGQEEWLYPALRHSEAAAFMAVAGCRGNAMREMDPSDVFDEPYAWVSKKR